MAVSAFIAEVSDDPEGRSTADLAAELLRTGRELAAAHCRWLTLLAEFDRRAGWAADGALSCVDWIVWRIGVGRSTAKEKLRVAHEIRRRPSVRAAFAAGDVSYSKVRAITRVVGAGAATDRRNARGRRGWDNRRRRASGSTFRAVARTGARGRRLPQALRPTEPARRAHLRRDDGDRDGPSDRGGRGASPTRASRGSCGQGFS